MTWPQKKLIMPMFFSFLLVLVATSPTFAACSPYIGQASINEVNVHSQGNNARTYYVEIKALNYQILDTSPPLWQNWTLDICSEEGRAAGDRCQEGIPIAGGSLQNSWLVIDQDIIQWDYLDLNDGNNHGMEIVLRDENDAVVDYLSVDGYSVSGSSGCSFFYDTTFVGGNNFNIQRQPDGVGEWDSTGGGNSGDETENDTNDPVPDGSPNVSVADSTSAAGTSMVFTVQLSAPHDSPVSIQYSTRNGTAIAGSDYLVSSGTVLIQAGQLSAEISVVTLPAATDGAYFFIELSSVLSDNAVIVNNLASGTILRLGSAVTHFRMDEPVGSWNGSYGEVIDSGGTALNGRWASASGNPAPINPAPSIAAQHPSVIGSFCNAATFDGNSVIEVADSPLFDYTSQLSATAWIYPTAYPGSGLYSILSNDVNYEFHLNSSGRLNWWWGGGARELTSNAIIPLNQWTHVAITLDSSSGERRQRIYINGMPDVNTNNWQGTLSTNNCRVHIGGDVNTGNCAIIPARNFHGMIDEVKLYDFELTQEQVRIDMTIGRSCSGAFDHLRIEHNSAASVCSPETVTVKACLDSACAALYPGSVTVNLMPSGWVNGGSFTFSGGVSTRQLSVTTPGVVTLGTSSVTPTPAVSTRCFNGENETCQLDFVQASCTFDAVEPGMGPQSPIFTKLSGVPFTIDVLALDDPVTINTKYKETVAVDLVDSTTSACPSGPGLTPATNISFKNQNNGRMAVTFNYLNAARNVRVRAIVGASLPACSADNFSIRPQSFEVSSSNANNHTLTGLPVIAAGDPFNLRATALAGYDGTPQLNSGLVDGTPLAGLLTGSFPTANAVTGITAGTEFRYWEVGHFGLGLYAVYDNSFTQVDAVKGECTSNFSNNLVGGMYGCSFGSQAIPFIAGTSGFGRFIPARFSIVANTPSFVSACNSFTYQGQEFDYLTDPQLTLTALNRNGGVTRNYGNTYWKLNSLFFGRSYANNAAVTASALLLSTAGTVTWTGTGDTDGEGMADVVGDRLTYSKSLIPEGPFDADVELTFSSFDLTDTDGVCYDPEDDGVCNSYTINGIRGTELRYGRMLLQNAHGPETQTLTIPVRTEYYNGSAFTLNESDNCTTYDSSRLSLTINLADNGTTTASGSGFLVSGLGNNLSLSAPGVGHEGSVDLELDLSTATGLGFEWLQPDGNNPTAKATFGIYRGNSRLIYMRESVW